MGAGTILHINAVGFMAAIEENLDTSLRGRPFALAHEAAGRAVVLDLSPAAHAEGLRRGMPLAQALRMIRHLEVREPRPDLYALADESLGRICGAFTPLVEAAGRGHLFLDLAGTTGINGPAEDAAQKIRRRILEETGLCPVLALAGSKTISKVATRVFRPAGFVALSPREETSLFRMQPVELLPGVGPMLLGRFGLLGIQEIGDLADLTTPEARALGPKGPELVRRSQGADDSPVNPEPPDLRRTKGEILFEPDVMEAEILRVRLSALAAELAFSLRANNLGARKAQVSITYTDKVRSEARARSARLLVRDDELASLAQDALIQARSRRVRVRRIVLEFSDQGSAGPELDLFEPEDFRLFRLQTALDRVKVRYGLSAIAPAALLAIQRRSAVRGSAGVGTRTPQAAL